MESFEGDRAATDVEQDLGEPSSSVETLDVDRAGSGGGLVGVEAILPTESGATDVGDDVASASEARPD